MVDAEHRLAVRDALLEVETSFPADEYDTMLNYHLGVLAHQVGEDIEAIDRFSWFTAPWQGESPPDTADETELAMARTAAVLAADAARRTLGAEVAGPLHSAVSRIEARQARLR